MPKLNSRVNRINPLRWSTLWGFLKTVTAGPKACNRAGCCSLPRILSPKAAFVKTSRRPCATLSPTHVFYVTAASHEFVQPPIYLSEPVPDAGFE